jgi:hypothetical protein
MHKAAAQIPTAIYPKIKSIVMFGDPNLRLGRLGDPFPTALRSKVLQNCAVNDPVCTLPCLAACAASLEVYVLKNRANAEYRSVTKEVAKSIISSTFVLSGLTEP